MCLPDLPTVADFGAATLKNNKSKPLRRISWSELAKHNTLKDAWIAIKGRVYDITSFADLHPGGDLILTAAGLDATDVFVAFHSATSAVHLLPPLCVRQVDTPTSPLLGDGVTPEYVSDVQKLHNEMYKLRLFDSSKLYYAFKVLSNIAICATGPAIAMDAPTNTFPVVIGVLLMAFFWQQCGWLAHDFLHHQVFNWRPMNDVFGILVGNVFQRFSLSWWKNKHNHHHAVPNCTDAPTGGDPDIATLPILFWSEKLIEQEKLEDLPRWMLRNQALLYWPIMCMARTSWVIQSPTFHIQKRNPYYTALWLFVSERLGLFTHHALYFALVYKIGTASVINAIVFNVVAQAFGGLFLSCVFTVGHNAMDVLTEKEMRQVDFVRLQTRTTRNVDPHWFTNWFCGGLNYQVEHDIFPSIPRHNLPTAAKMFRQFCLKHSIPYTSESLIQGNKSVCALLEKVSKTA